MGILKRFFFIPAIIMLAVCVLQVLAFGSKNNKVI